MTAEPLHLDRYAAEGLRRGTVIAVPGLAESAACLEHPGRRWAHRGWDVAVIDPRGHGRSPRWSPEQLAVHPGDVIVDDLEGGVRPLLGETRGPVVLFGHSAGGSAVAALAARLGPVVSALVLEDPFWRLPVTRHQDPAVAEEATALLARARRMSDEQRRNEVRAEHPSWPEDELSAWSSAKEQIDLDLVSNGDVIPSPPWPELVGRIVANGTRVLVITGTVRHGMTDGHIAILRDAGCQVDVFEGASHFVRRDRRSAFHDLVDPWIDEVEQASQQA